MTCLEAAALGVLGQSRRRVVASVVRALQGRAIPDYDQPPAREADEPVVVWACRGAGLSAGRARAEASALLRLAAGHLKRARAAGIVPVPLGDPAYPPVLAEIADPPPLLWVRGDAASLSARAVAIVGSRAATPYGLDVARQLAGDLAASGLVVVSGLARGIDSAAHRGALDAGGRTLAVLGSGLDRVYPPEHEGLAHAIAQRGAVVTELPPGAAPRAHHFPLRNRLISGLSAAVVVVEASEKSGSLITAACALDQGRDVMAVPGPVRAGRFRGAHALLRDGAKLVETADDILREVGFVRPAASGDRPGAGGRGDDLGLGVPAEVVDFSADEVSEWTGKPPDQVLPALALLELEGRIRRLGGGRFCRACRAAC